MNFVLLIDTYSTYSLLEDGVQLPGRRVLGILQRTADGNGLSAEVLYLDVLGDEGDLKSVARNQLSERLAAGALEGSVDIAPKAIRPGYSYPVDELDGETLALERVTFSEGIDGARGSLAFGDLEDPASRLAGISSGVKSVKDAF